VILDPRQFPELDVYGVIGNPVAHSLSPQIHEQFAKQTGQMMHYGKLFSAEQDFIQTVDTFFKRGGKGLNVTVPFKERAFALCHRLTDRAKMAGVVNILWQEDGAYCGDNSDGLGLVRDIEQMGYPLADQRILLLGAGGAVQGVVLPILQQNPNGIMILNRTHSKAQAIVTRFQAAVQARNVTLQASSFEEWTDHPQGFDRIINGTSAGLTNVSPLTDVMIERLAEHSEPSATLAYDMVYGKETAFMQHMQQAGFAVKDGLGMLVEQAAVAFEGWRGISSGQLQTREVYDLLRARLVG